MLNNIDIPGAFKGINISSPQSFTTERVEVVRECLISLNRERRGDELSSDPSRVLAECAFALWRISMQMLNLCVRTRSGVCYNIA